MASAIPVVLYQLSYEANWGLVTLLVSNIPLSVMKDIWAAEKGMKALLRVTEKDMTTRMHKWKIVYIWVANIETRLAVIRQTILEFKQGTWIDSMQKWLPLIFSFVRTQNSLTNLVRDNKFFTIFVSKTRLVRLLI